MAELPVALFGGDLDFSELRRLCVSFEDDGGVTDVLRLREVDLCVDVGSDALVGGVCGCSGEEGDGQGGDELQHGISLVVCEQRSVGLY